VVYDVGEDREMAFIAMEYVDGPSLQQVAQSGRKLQPAEVVDTYSGKSPQPSITPMRTASWHRDIKPT